MSGGWRGARLRRRVMFGVCGAALVALASVLRTIDDVASESVLVSVIGAVVSVAALLADVLRGDADPPPQPGDDVRRRAADQLADAVREQWAAEFRLRRLQDPEPVDVRWTAADPRLADHPENVRRIPTQRDGERRLGDVVAAFGSVPGRRLVVLGGPGSGKTVLALRFTLGRLAERQAGGPVPVIFQPAGWDPRHTGLRDWLAERLAAEHRPLALPAGGQRTLARALLDSGLVLPVLDGFDELPEDVYGMAVRRINSELDDDLPLLLTSRPRAWRTAVDEGDVLTAAQVVRLLPLEIGQSAAHLERTARPLPAAGALRTTVWTPVLERLARDPDDQLAAVLTVPLMVALARTVYGDRTRDPAELLDRVRFPTGAHIEEHLLEAFVPAAFTDTGAHGAAEAKRRLGRLARELDRRGTARFGWWELESMTPRLLRVYAPGLVAIVVNALLLIPALLSRAWSDPATVDDSASLLMTLVGQSLGYAFGVAFLLPPAGGRVPRAAFLRRQLAVATAAAAVLWAGFAFTDDLRFGFRFGAVTDGWLPDLLAGCLFALLFCLFFGIAGLSRRPRPLSLPWAGGHRGRAAARGCGGALAALGAAVLTAVLAGVADSPWTALFGTVCGVAGGVLLLGATRRAERDSAPLARPGRVVRGLAARLVRGTAAALLVGVAATTAGGLAAVGVTVLKSAPKEGLDGRRIGGWEFRERHGVRFATTGRPLRGTLLYPARDARPVAYPRRTSPPNCRLPLVTGRSCDAFTARRTAFEARDGAVVVRLATRDGLRTADAAGLRSELPPRARDWLTEGSSRGTAGRLLPPILAAGVLVGLVGGCVCGVYHALSTPSDVMRAAGPRSSLRTDRTASLARGALAALATAVVCVPVVTMSRDWGGFVQAGTQLWVPVGTAALALSAWGRLAVARIWLAASGRMPWRCMAFLDEAHRRGVLRQSGAYYEFRHLRLQRQLAAEPVACPADRPLGVGG
ncbi:hypothetical protein SZN_14646 [Streptomyces zinciresistens K42]|uniref:NACHT domain-containing protein n=1 Tax=Streptomyces zinciresistens K42 TaxID=700597 RepID=G2GBQ5_9ACTN|nr:NACHT domain-containing protein [Streptomyces zinciresistens]EGX59078.1 hypothetical protein SZN_14646 [Streptomyces zinciresistens K42]